MKKIVLTLTAIILITTIIPLQSVTAQETESPKQQLTLEERDALRQKNFSAFLKDTVELRKELAQKQDENSKLLLAEKPDRAKIAMVTEQIYQLIDVLDEKARAYGLKPGMGSGTAGCGCGGPASARSL